MHRKLLFSAAAVVLLAGCESDDLCSIGTCPLPGTVGTVGTNLNASNAVVALREGWLAASSSADLPFFVVATGIGDTSGGTVSLPTSNFSVTSAPFLNVVPIDEEYNCPVSGTFAIVGDVTDITTVTAGDFWEYSATACEGNTGYTVDGGLRVDILAIEGVPATGMYEQTQTLTMTDFAATNQAGSTTLNGDHTASIDNRQLNNISSSYTGNSLSFNDSVANVTVQNFSGLISIDTASPFLTTMTGSGTFSSSLIQGALVYRWEEPFHQRLGEDPHDGNLDITGDNSIVRLAIGETSVVLQVDANNSGNFEISQFVTWDEFLNGDIDLTTVVPVGD